MKMFPLAALVAALGVSAAAAQEPIVLKLATGSPSSSSTWKELIVPWAERVEAASEGTIKFEYYADGQLSKMGDTYNRVAAGVADVGWDLPPLYGKQFLLMSVTGLPGLYSDTEIASPAFFRGIVNGKISKEMDDFKVIFTSASVNGSFFLKEPLKSNTNLEGWKIAVNSKQRAEAVQGMGGTPVSISPPEQYQALSKGVLDGALSSMGAVSAYKLFELTHYYLVGPFGGSSSAMLMNKAKYESLPPKAKKAIDDNSTPEQSRIVGEWFKNFEETAMGKIAAMPGNQRVVISEEDLKAWQPVFDKIVDSWIEETPGGKETIAAFRAEMKAGM